MTNAFCTLKTLHILQLSGRPTTAHTCPCSWEGFRVASLLWIKPVALVPQMELEMSLLPSWCMCKMTPTMSALPLHFGTDKSYQCFFSFWQFSLSRLKPFLDHCHCSPLHFLQYAQSSWTVVDKLRVWQFKWSLHSIDNQRRIISCLPQTVLLFVHLIVALSFFTAAWPCSFMLSCHPSIFFCRTAAVLVVPQSVFWYLLTPTQTQSSALSLLDGVCFLDHSSNLSRLFCILILLCKALVLHGVLC